jgi:hypothetical protein
LFTTKVDEPVLVMTLLAKGKKYTFGFDGISGAPDVPDTNPHAIMCPDVDPFTQNALSNVPECTLPVVQSPSPLPDPRSTVLLVVSALELVKFAGTWLTAPPMPSTTLHPVKANIWSVVGLAGSVTAIGGSTIPVPAPWVAHPTSSCAAYVLPGFVRLTAYK